MQYFETMYSDDVEKKRFKYFTYEEAENWSKGNCKISYAKEKMFWSCVTGEEFFYSYRCTVEIGKHKISAVAADTGEALRECIFHLFMNKEFRAEYLSLRQKEELQNETERVIKQSKPRRI